jgi:hypothetical protein
MVLKSQYNDRNLAKGETWIRDDCQLPLCRMPDTDRVYPEVNEKFVVRDLLNKSPLID